MRCLSVSLSVCHVRELCKTNKHIIKHFTSSGRPIILVFSVPNGIAIFRRVLNTGGVGIKRDSKHLALVPAVSAATCQVLSTRSPVDHGHRSASYDTSLVVSGGVDRGRRRRNVYDKKPQCYAIDNRTAHLTARSDKSVAYVTNNKRLFDVFYC